MYRVPYTIYTNHQSLKYFFTQKNLKMRQQIWLELVSDYDVEIHYHLGKANKVAYTLSRKSSASLSVITEWVPQLRVEISNFELELIIGRLSSLILAPTILEDIGTKQDQDPELLKIKKEVQEGKSMDFCINDTWVLLFRSWLCVPNVDYMRKQLMLEAHATPYAMHPGSTKM